MHFCFFVVVVLVFFALVLRELVDSLCRNGADAQYMQYLNKSRITSPQTLKAYLSNQASSLSGFVISKTHKWPKAT